MEFVNEFVIQGKVLVIRSDNRCSIRLLSKAGKKETFPLVYCSRAALERSGIRVGMHVKITGRVGNYPVKRVDGKNAGFRQEFRATEVIQNKTMCSEKFNVDGKFYHELSTVVYLGGKFVSSHVRDDGWMSIQIQTGAKPSSTITVNMKKLDRQPKFAKGEPICVVGTISTVNKTFGDVKRHYENIIVNDIGKPKE